MSVWQRHSRGGRPEAYTARAQNVLESQGAALVGCASIGTIAGVAAFIHVCCMRVHIWRAYRFTASRFSDCVMSAYWSTSCICAVSVDCGLLREAVRAVDLLDGRPSGGGRRAEARRGASALGVAMHSGSTACVVPSICHPQFPACSDGMKSRVFFCAEGRGSAITVVPRRPWPFVR